MGVEDREELAKWFVLENLLQEPLAKNISPHRRNSELTPGQARHGAQEFLGRTRLRVKCELGKDQWNDFIDSAPPITVVCLGNKVWKSFNLPTGVDWFHWEPVEYDFAMVKFPHPSGLNQSLNDPIFAREVATRLRHIALGELRGPNPA
jgi:hypothetical protein